MLVLSILVFVNSYAQRTLWVVAAKDSVPMTGAVLVAESKGYVYSAVANHEGAIFIPQEDWNQLSGAKFKIFCTGYEPLEFSSLQPNQKFFLKSLFLSTGEVVITGQMTPRSIADAVHSIKVIDKKKIDAMGAVTLRDVLTNELFVRQTNDNILGAGMSMQGVSGENVKILRDGIPVIGRMNGNIDLSQLNLSDIERIEIVEGPLSVSYGTNALGGTINLIPKRAKRYMSTSQLQLFTDNTGNYNANLSLLTSIKNHSITISGFRNFFDGWSEGEKDYWDFSKQVADSNRWKQWKPKEQYGAELGYNYRINKWDLGVRSNYFKETILNRQKPIQPYFERAFDDRYITQRFDNSIQVRYRDEHDRNFNGFIAYNQYTRYKNTYLRDLTDLSEQMTQVSGDQDTSAFNLLSSRATYAAQLNEWIKYEWGYDINLESAKGVRIQKDYSSLNDLATFAGAEIEPLTGFMIRPALRYSYNSRYDVPLIPSLNLKWTRGDYDVRASAARGFRAPTLKELFFYFVDSNHNIQGNTNLKPEDSWYYSLQGTRTINHNQGNVRVIAGAFANYITNMITLAQVQGIEFTYFNVGKYSAHGGSLELISQYRNIETSIAGSVTGRANRLNEVLVDTPDYYYTHELRCNISYNWIQQQIVFNSYLKYYGSMQGFEVDEFGDFSYSKIDPYTMWDISVSRKWWKQQLNTTLGVRNLLDVSNVNSVTGSGTHNGGVTNSRPISTGRMYFLSLTFNLTKQKDA